MTRFNDWERRLSEFFNRAAEARFSYGRLDCCKFTSSAIEAMTGADVSVGFSYSTEKQALALIRKYGSIGKLAQAIADRFGLESVPVKKARRGDAVLVEHNGREMLGVVSLRGDMAVLKTKNGLLHVSLVRYGQAAWRV